MRAPVLKASRSLAILLVAGMATFAMAQESNQAIGLVETGRSYERTIGPRGDGNFAWHEQYVVLPAGLASVTVTVTSADDVDFAARFGGPMQNYDEADYLAEDLSGNITYTVENPPAGELWFDVVNFYERPIPYSVTVSTTMGAPTPQAPQQAGGMVKPGFTAPQTPQAPQAPQAPQTPQAPVTPPASNLPPVVPATYPAATPYGMQGSLNPGVLTYGNLDRGTEREFSTYHTWTVQVPEGAAFMTVTLQPTSTLTIALKHGSEIMSYDAQSEGGDWQYTASPAAAGQFATVTVPAPAAGTWYMDVINVNSQVADGRYIVQVAFQ